MSDIDKARELAKQTDISLCSCCGGYDEEKNIIAEQFLELDAEIKELKEKFISMSIEANRAGLAEIMSAHPGASEEVKR